MVISKATRGRIYLVSVVVMLVLNYPLGWSIPRALGYDIGLTAVLWGIPAAALWLGTRKKDATSILAYIAPGILFALCLLVVVSMATG